MPLKLAGERKVIEPDVRNLDVAPNSEGSAVYGLDAELPGMAYAMPLLPRTRYGSTVNAIDESVAKVISGYISAIPVNDPSQTVHGCVTVAAETLPAAIKATKVVKVDWSAGPTVNVDDAAIISEGMRIASDSEGGALYVCEGDIAAAKSGATNSIAAT